MQQQSYKQIAIDFLNLTAAGASREAFEKYVGEGFKHHNIYFKGDAETIMLAMEENAKQMPEKTFKILHALEDGDMVSTHSHFKQNATDPGYAITHILRFENGKIMEMWDFGQQVPRETVNENGMF